MVGNTGIKRVKTYFAEKEHNAWKNLGKWHKRYLGWTSITAWAFEAVSAVQDGQFKVNKEVNNNHACQRHLLPQLHIEGQANFTYHIENLRPLTSVGKKTNRTGMVLLQCKEPQPKRQHIRQLRCWHKSIQNHISYCLSDTIVCCNKGIWASLEKTSGTRIFEASKA